MTSSPNEHASLDYAFLKHIGVSVDGEAVLHSWYLPMLAGRQRVIDLGCGMGGFVAVMRQAGFDATGVDSDPSCIAEARSHGLPVIEADVIQYLRGAQAGSCDAIVAAHLVEHLPYEVVLELVEQAHRVLAPGGRLLLITPNPRALVSHLELYPMHFGHVAMYHPNLLAFFMRHAGFVSTAMGENPATTAEHVAANSPTAELRRVAQAASAAGSPVPIREVLPKPPGLLRGAIWRVKMGLVNWLVQPYFDRAVAEIHGTGQTVSDAIQLVDRPFECFVIGDKA